MNLPLTTATRAVLQHLLGRESPITAGDLASATQVKGKQLFVIIERLQSEGWVFCKVDKFAGLGPGAKLTPRCFKLTPLGRQEAPARLAQA
jgi:predicted ArsR family transcriptional regulator